MWFKLCYTWFTWYFHCALPFSISVAMETYQWINLTCFVSMINVNFRNMNWGLVSLLKIHWSIPRGLCCVKMSGELCFYIIIYVFALVHNRVQTIVHKNACIFNLCQIQVSKHCSCRLNNNDTRWKSITLPSKQKTVISYVFPRYNCILLDSVTIDKLFVPDSENLHLR